MTAGASAYRIYLEFLETAEKKRRWNIFDDIPWDTLGTASLAAATTQAVEIFCTEELYVPDYSLRGLEMLRSRFGLAFFQICWAQEEARHGLAFREYLSRTAARSEAELDVLATEVATHPWQLPYQSARQMACYGALQEGATYLAYRTQREQARAAGDQVLDAIFHLVGRDEAAHSGFYRAVVELELNEDRLGTIADLAHVLATFKMPGDGLIANYRARLRECGSGISGRMFLERVVSPLLTTLQIERRELKAASAKHDPAATVDQPSNPQVLS